MKKLFLPLLILCINATISCKKETVANDKMLSAVSQNISNNEIAGGATNFGAILVGGSSDDHVKVAKSLGISCARTTIILTDFRKGKDNMVDKYMAEGYKILLNLNYKQVHNKNPNPFTKDLVGYRKLLEDVLSKYKPDVAVIENEPTTKLFHSGLIEDYIAMLKVAVEVCHQYGVKVTDGSINVAYVQQIMRGASASGSRSGSNQNADETKKLIAAYAQIPLDYVNVHAMGSGNSYQSDLLKNVADYLRTTTGKQVLSNEWHVETNSTNLIESMVQGWKDGGYAYSVVYSGSSASGGNVPLSKGTTLTSLGIAYRNKIK